MPGHRRIVAGVQMPALALSILLLQSGAGAREKPMTALEDAVGGFDGVVGLCARNLETGDELALNADIRFPTASVIKTAVMLEAYRQAEAGGLPMRTPVVLHDRDKVGGSGVLNGLSDGVALPVADLVHLMIVVSDNTATNLLVERLGTRRINETLESYGLTSTKIFRPTFRDGRPDVHAELERAFGLGMSTPREMMTLMALIAEGRAVSPGASAAMLATLRRQQDRAMIPRLLPAGTTTANKTGTDTEKLPDDQGRQGGIRADAAIVTAGGLRYAIAIFVRRSGDTSFGVDNAAVTLGARLARIVHERFGNR